MKRLENIEILERLNDPIYEFFQKICLTIENKCGKAIYTEMVIGLVDQLDNAGESVYIEIGRNFENGKEV